MSDPLIIKTAGKAGAAAIRQPAATGTGTKFSAVQEKVSAKQQNVNLPSEVKGVTTAERRRLEAALRKKIQSADSGTPRPLFRNEVRKIENGVNELSTKVAALPKTAAFDPVRARLTSIETRFRESGKMIGSLTSADNPRELLKAQVSMYELSLNIQLVSKVVDQVNSGVKQLLQTQL